MPRYKHKTKGRNLLTYTIQAISKTWLKKGIVNLSGTDIKLPTKASNIAQARIVPRVGQYVIEIVYEKDEFTTVTDSQAIASIDIGVNNLAALTSNQIGFVPILINGRPLKSLNQFYNKKKAQLQSLLRDSKGSSNRITLLTAKRNNRVDSYLHQASSWVVNHLDKRGIGKLVIGKNPLWKQEVNNGKKNNQSFTSIPHARFVEMLTYKAQMKGIEVLINEESYTSRASFLNLDFIPTYGTEEAKDVNFSGYRESRGMYKIKGKKIRINADINASYNILRKAMKCGLGGFPHEQLHQEVIPTAFAQGIEGVVLKDTASHIVRPIRVTPGRAKSGQCYI